ncbi:TonB-dependent receptor [Nguyenibacter vanlangensis]|uniref:TonB-dependent receptor n=1 Tax=Nguyenibacter vanlangensis TaxID=1216886 RepID=A0A7Y7IWN8_9PROT|nr:TonB-dependent receptor [Nguyenibacter vanlangensis]NVN11699.1 TonB-dependent receptor [Nguyenibacter vanlangensis]
MNRLVVSGHRAASRTIGRRACGLASTSLICAGMIFNAATALAAQAGQDDGQVQPTQAGSAARQQSHAQRTAIQAGQRPEQIESIGHQLVNSAAYQAPSKAPLAAFQPTSVISQHFIQNNAPPSANYDTIAAISPSVTAISTNGPGLSESQGLSIRGFQDGQYNVLLDGIPFADTNNFTHHSTNYFMAHDLGDMSVDRGPGDASTIGYATFGGTISVTTKNPLDRATAEAYGSVGSWSTNNYGGEFDSGRLKSLNGGAFFVDMEALDSNGYLTYADQHRANFMGKWVQPVGRSTTLTVMAMHNRIVQDVPPGVSLKEIATYGPNYGLSNNPHAQNYQNINVDHIQTDMEYIGLNSDLGAGWLLNNKVYTYAYVHHGDNAGDVNGNLSGTLAYSKTYYSPAGDDIPGQRMHNDYRAWGDTFDLSRGFGIVNAHLGLWIEHQSNGRQQYEVDWTQGGALNPPTIKANGEPAALDRFMHDQNLSMQPYLQLAIHALPNLTINPGFKYNILNRDIEAPVNQKTGAPLNYSQSYSAPMPSINVHYMASPNWSAYLQVARGFLAPDLAYFYVGDPSKNQVSPENTMNYQIGTAWQSRRFTLSGDVYYIDFDNLVASRTIGQNTEYFNQGGVNYYGAEAEGSVFLGRGFTLFANGSINQAKVKKTDQWVANAPEATMAGGLIYEHDGVYASLIEKWVGSRYGDTSQRQGLDPFSQLDFSLAYTFPRTNGWVPPVKVRMNVSNLLNSHKVVYFFGYAADKTPLFNTQAGRGIFLSLSVPVGL